MASFPVVDITPRYLPHASPDTGKGLADAAELTANAFAQKKLREQARQDRATELEAARAHDFQMAYLADQYARGRLKLGGDIESRQIGERGDVESDLIHERGGEERLSLGLSHDYRLGEIGATGEETRRTQRAGYELEAPQRAEENRQRWADIQNRTRSSMADYNYRTYLLNESQQGRGGGGGSKYPLQNMAWNIADRTGVLEDGGITPRTMEGIMRLAQGDPSGATLLMPTAGEETGSTVRTPPAETDRGAGGQAAPSRGAPELTGGSGSPRRSIFSGTGVGMQPNRFNTGILPPSQPARSDGGNFVFETPGGAVTIDPATAESLSGLSVQQHMDFLKLIPDVATRQDYISLLPMQVQTQVRDALGRQGR